MKTITSCHVDICFSPALYPFYARPGNLVVLIDVFRATTVICKALYHGAQALIPVSEISEAHSFDRTKYILAGERDGKKLEGFDMGNSPADFENPGIVGKNIVYTTTNGVQAIKQVNDGSEIVFGAYANYSALMYFLTKQKRDILFLCSGWKNKMNIEDPVLAGEMTRELISSGAFFTSGDSVSIADALKTKLGGSILYGILECSPRLRKKIDILGQDMRFALEKDTCPIIPVFEKGRIVVLKTS